MTKYRVFKYDSHNSGYYVLQDMPLYHSLVTTRELSKIGAKKARIEGDNGSFELYENNHRTEWSIIPLRKIREKKTDYDLVTVMSLKRATDPALDTLAKSLVKNLNKNTK